MVRGATASTARGSLREVQQGEQRIVHRLGGRKGAYDAWIENDHIGALLETLDVFPADELAEVGATVFWPEIVFYQRFILLHRVSCRKMERGWDRVQTYFPGTGSTLAMRLP
jgi:hypothetical protein